MNLSFLKSKPWALSDPLMGLPENNLPDVDDETLKDIIDWAECINPAEIDFLIHA